MLFYSVSSLKEASVRFCTNEKYHMKRFRLIIHKFNTQSGYCFTCKHLEAKKSKLLQYKIKQLLVIALMILLYYYKWNELDNVSTILFYDDYDKNPGHYSYGNTKEHF
jgi:hypothetical protein